jgi:hypothetical protein
MTDEEKVNERDSNELLNIILMVLGALFVTLGVIQILPYFGIDPPGWLGTILSESEGAMALIGQAGLVTTVLGVWCFIAGVGLMREEEWAWGIGLVVLSLMFVNSIGSFISWVTVPGAFDVADFTTWITLLGLIVSVLGFLWLIFTKTIYK